MVRRFDDLPRAMRDLGNKRIPQAVNSVVQQVATGIGATVVETTRVDTGRARSNWRATLNVPASGVIPAYAPGNKLGASERANAEAAKAQQRQVIQRFNVLRHRGIFITNNTPYIEQLNNGRPNLAPGLMVEQGIQIGRNIFRSIRVRLVD